MEVVGHDKKERLCEEAIKDILVCKSWETSYVDFLIYCEAIDEAEKYILKHASELDGDRYYSLLPIARAMEENKKCLTASLIYRALLDSILHRAISKYYHHGVEYYHKLHTLSHYVHDWFGFPSHDKYLSEIKAEHGRKSSFWGRLNG